MSSKKRISILLGHSVNIPSKSSGGVEKVFEEIFYKWDQGNFEYTLIGKTSIKKMDSKQISFNKKIIKLNGYKWSTYKIVNLILSLFWCLKAKKYLKNSDFVIYNSVFGPLIHRIFNLKGMVSYCDQRGTGKVNFLIPSFTLDRLYVISNIVKNSWNKRYTNKIMTIPNCVNIDLFNFVERYNRTHNGYKMLFVGRIVEEKGLILLLNSLKLLLNVYRLPIIQLNIIGPFETTKGGSENYYKECNHFVIQNNLEDYVKFLGEKTSSEINDFLSVSDVFIMSSIWEEAFGIVNIEALATGLPIVGFNKGALPEIIQNKEEGFLVNEITSEALAAGIFNHYNLSVEDKILMEKKCRLKAENYDSRKIAELYLNDIKMFLN